MSQRESAPYDQSALDAASREVHMMLLREGSSWGTKACEEMGRVFMTAYLAALPSERGEPRAIIPNEFRDAIRNAAFEEAAEVAMNMPLNSGKEHHSYRWSDTGKAVSWDIAHAIRALKNAAPTGDKVSVVAPGSTPGLSGGESASVPCVEVPREEWNAMCKALEAFDRHERAAAKEAPFLDHAYDLLALVKSAPTPKGEQVNNGRVPGSRRAASGEVGKCHSKRLTDVAAHQFQPSERSNRT